MSNRIDEVLFLEKLTALPQNRFAARVSWCTVRGYSIAVKARQ
jgi:hypothetical protein